MLCHAISAMLWHAIAAVLRYAMMQHTVITVMSCGIHTCTPARKKYTNFQPYYFANCTTSFCRLSWAWAWAAMNYNNYIYIYIHTYIHIYTYMYMYV